MVTKPHFIYFYQPTILHTVSLPPLVLEKVDAFLVLLIIDWRFLCSLFLLWNYFSCFSNWRNNNFIGENMSLSCRCLLLLMRSRLLSTVRSVFLAKHECKMFLVIIGFRGCNYSLLYGQDFGFGPGSVEAVICRSLRTRYVIVLVGQRHVSRWPAAL
jgi:hypothetical protein